MRYASTERKSKSHLRNAISRFTIKAEARPRWKQRRLLSAGFFSGLQTLKEANTEKRRQPPLPAAMCQLASGRRTSPLPGWPISTPTKSRAGAPTPAQQLHTHPGACLDRRDVADMRHRTTHTNISKIYKLLAAWIRTSHAAQTQRIFADPDAAARQQGWQVSSTHRGFGRSYRDPRFDTLASCGDCLGRGTKSPGNPCHTCTGTGRITVRPADEPPPSPPRGLA
jgi:hypothetical protein